ncbi:MAG TPA: hypothetical protein VFF65_10130, partial [Phycisphaerales bacterium]|nr:hypothetical protein [Phycisphaerales bacterium]
MSMFPGVTARYKALPRVGRWGVWLVVALIAYFGAVEPAVEWSARKATEADRLEKALVDRTRLGADAGTAADALQRSI